MPTIAKRTQQPTNTILTSPTLPRLNARSCTFSMKSFLWAFMRMVNSQLCIVFITATQSTLTILIFPLLFLFFQSNTMATTMIVTQSLYIVRIPITTIGICTLTAAWSSTIWFMPINMICRKWLFNPALQTNFSCHISSPIKTVRNGVMGTVPNLAPRSYPWDILLD